MDELLDFCIFEEEEDEHVKRAEACVFAKVCVEEREKDKDDRRRGQRQILSNSYECDLNRTEMRSANEKRCGNSLKRQVSEVKTKDSTLEAKSVLVELDSTF